MTKTARRRSTKPGAGAAREAEPAGGDTRERIMRAAEDLLRRHGPAKTTVVDVARALDMSHANVYRHFASKQELQDAVAEDWLKRVSAPLQAIVAGKGGAGDRLERWMLTLAKIKRAKVLDDPELFATYHAVAVAARRVIEEHVGELRRQVAAIIRDGVRQGEFKVKDADTAALAVLHATAQFHHPHHVKESGGRNRDAELRAVLKLVLAGLRAGSL